MENQQKLEMPHLTGDLKRFYQHKVYMHEAFGIITVDEAQKASRGFVGGLYRSKALYARLAKMQLKEIGEFVRIK